MKIYKVDPTTGKNFMNLSNINKKIDSYNKNKTESKSESEIILFKYSSKKNSFGKLIDSNGNIQEDLSFKYGSINTTKKKIKEYIDPTTGKYSSNIKEINKNIDLYNNSSGNKIEYHLNERGLKVNYQGEKIIEKTIPISITIKKPQGNNKIHSFDKLFDIIKYKSDCIENYFIDPELYRENFKFTDIGHTFLIVYKDSQIWTILLNYRFITNLLYHPPEYIFNVSKYKETINNFYSNSLSTPDISTIDSNEEWAKCEPWTLINIDNYTFDIFYLIKFICTLLDSNVNGNAFPQFPINPFTKKKLTPDNFIMINKIINENNIKIERKSLQLFLSDQIFWNFFDNWTYFFIKKIEKNNRFYMSCKHIEDIFSFTTCWIDKKESLSDEKLLCEELSNEYITKYSFNMNDDNLKIFLNDLDEPIFLIYKLLNSENNNLPEFTDYFQC